MSWNYGGNENHSDSYRLEAMLGLPPLHLVIQNKALLEAYRFKIIGIDVPYIKGDHTEIFKKLGDNHLLSMNPDRITRTPIPLSKPFQTILTDRAKWGTGKSPLPKGEEWYTDGSKTTSGTGAGIYNEETGSKISINLGRYATIFQAEIMAILTSAQEMMRRGYQNRTLLILTDSLAAINALNAYETMSRLVLECVQNLTVLATANTVKLVWIPGHYDIPGNSKADELAKLGAKTAMIGPEPTCGLSYSVAKNVIKEMLYNKHATSWRQEGGLIHSRWFLVSPLSGKSSNEIISLSRRKIRMLTGIITGHCNLNKHLHTIGLRETDVCRACLDEEETPIHILCHCEAFNTQRINNFGLEKIVPEDVHKIPWRRLIDFFEELELG